MPPLYVVEQGAKLNKQGRRLVVSKEGETLQSVPLIKIDQVLLFGNVGLTTPALTWLMGRGIDVIFCKQDGTYRGRVVGPSTGHSRLRRLQYRRVENAAFSLETARIIVRAKLQNSRTLLRRYRRRQGQPALDPSIERLSELLDQSTRANGLPRLMGLEGAGAAAYFAGLRHLFARKEWLFEKRVRRPPTDPVNVLLSFGYTLLTRQMEATVERVGLDPYLGCLHRDSYNRPSLALDLVEEFRAIVVDSVVLRCLNSELITPADFSRQDDPGRPVLLGEAGRNRFIREFEGRLALTFTHPALGEKVTYRRCLELQARDMARAFQAGNAYRPFVVR